MSIAKKTMLKKKEKEREEEHLREERVERTDRIDWDGCVRTWNTCHKRILLRRQTTFISVQLECNIQHSIEISKKKEEDVGFRNHARYQKKKF